MPVQMLTGFGLGGHATEMAVASDRTIVIDTEKLPVLPDVEEFASMGLIPGGAYRNREFAEKTGVKSVAELWREDLVFDPQTSGGIAGGGSGEGCAGDHEAVGCGWFAGRCDRRGCGSTGVDVGAPVGLELTSGRLAGKYKLCIFFIYCLPER